jgi:release factor glutamine methyltransferase
MPETLRQILDETAKKLSKAEIEQPRHEAAWLAAGLLGLSLAKLYASTEQEIDSRQASKIREGADRRARHVPMAYILGSAEFSGLTFLAGPGALAPRPDSECLVEAGLAVLSGQYDHLSDQGLSIKNVSPVRILDLCAGTGIIGISLADRLMKMGRAEDLLMTEIDLSAAGYAAQNLVRHGFSASQILTADLFPDDSSTRWHLVTANPPYIPSGDIDALMPEVSLHEPRIALDGGPDGLDVIRRIVREAPDHLLPGGWLLLEHGYDQADAVRQLLEKSGRFRPIPPIRDFGGHYRVSGGCLKASPDQGSHEMRDV